MIKKILMAGVAASLALTTNVAEAKSKKEKRAAQIPTCTQSVGSIAIVDPEKNWWNSYKLDSPQNIIKYFALRSGCFRVVDRSRGLKAALDERDLATSGNLQRGSNIGQGQMVVADFFMVPDLVSANRNAGGMSAKAGILGGLGGGWLGRAMGGLGSKKKEANVTLTLMDARTTEALRLTEGYAKKKDLKWGLGGGAGQWWGPVMGANIGSYQNTDIGQVLTLAYLDAFKDMVVQLGGQLQEADDD